MEAHARWLIRVGAFFLALHPYTPYALYEAQSHGIPVPGWLPFWAMYVPGAAVTHDWTIYLSPPQGIVITAVLGLPTLATFAALRENTILRRFQISILLIAACILLRDEMRSESSLPSMAIGESPRRCWTHFAGDRRGAMTFPCRSSRP